LVKGENKRGICSSRAKLCNYKQSLRFAATKWQSLRFAATNKIVVSELALKKIEFMFRKNIRLKFYDYKLNGYYFVTICCSYVAAERQLCIKYRDIIEKHLKGLEKNECVRLDFYIIMPDHIHFSFR
jgi:hypothetical protein